METTKWYNLAKNIRKNFKNTPINRTMAYRGKKWNFFARFIFVGNGSFRRGGNDSFYSV